MASQARQLADKSIAPPGRRNLIINGAMTVAQRGTAAATGLTQADDGYKNVDRWKCILSGTSSNSGVITMSYETDAPDDFKYSTKYLVTTADTDMGSDGALRLETHLEAQNLRHLDYGSSSAKQVTLSFWVKSNKTGSYSAGLYMDSAASGSDNEISQAYTINSANTWEYKTLTFAANTTTVMNPTDNDHGLRAWFFQAAGTDYLSGSSNTWSDDVSHRAIGQTVNLYDTVNNYWQVTGVQLEVGTVATEFEHRSFGEELALCQRYFYKTSSTLYGADYGSNSFTRTEFPDEMRVVPTVTGTNNKTVLTSYHSKQRIQYYLSGNGSSLSSGATADAEL